jgi:hypothetical protein
MLKRSTILNSISSWVFLIWLLRILEFCQGLHLLWFIQFWFCLQVLFPTITIEWKWFATHAWDGVWWHYLAASQLSSGICLYAELGWRCSWACLVQQHLVSFLIFFHRNIELSHFQFTLLALKLDILFQLLIDRWLNI